MSVSLTFWLNELAAEWSAPWLGLIDLFLKITVLLTVGLALDFALRRRWPVACATMWNAVLVGLLALPVGQIALPKTDLLSRLLPTTVSPVETSIAEAPSAATTRAATDPVGAGMVR